MSDKQEAKSWIKRAYDLAAMLSITGLLLIFFINQIDQFMDRRSEPTLVNTKEGIKCVWYRGQIGCVQVFQGTSI